VIVRTHRTDSGHNLLQ